MSIYDEDEVLIDDIDYDKKQKEREKEASKRYAEEGLPYVKDAIRTSWVTTIVWENEVTHSKKLLYLLGALDIIKLYTNGTPASKIYEKYSKYPEEEYNAMLGYLTKYFKQGQELFDQLAECKGKHL